MIRKIRASDAGRTASLRSQGLTARQHSGDDEKCFQEAGCAFHIGNAKYPIRSRRPSSCRRPLGLLRFLARREPLGPSTRANSPAAGSQSWSLKGDGRGRSPRATGWLSARFGRLRFFLICTVLFTVSSFLAFKAVHRRPSRVFPSDAGCYDVPVTGKVSAEKVWRYLSFPKFVSLLELRALWMCRLGVLEDQFEGTLPDKTSRAMVSQALEWRETFRQPELQEQLATMTDRNVDDGRRVLVVNCWFSGACESERMWEEYSSPTAGVAIRSTLTRLDRSILAKQEFTKVARGASAFLRRVPMISRVALLVAARTRIRTSQRLIARRKVFSILKRVAPTRVTAQGGGAGCVARSPPRGRARTCGRRRGRSRARREGASRRDSDRRQAG